ncbi:MAG: Zn-dependent hydrolase [uncultured archaeon A07HB70]|nr:MAG: Zn-dependent hydrolase [uncultured archaeon A07HB70]
MIGDVTRVAGDVYCVDTGAYEVPSYGAAYVVDAAEPAVVDTGTGADRETLFGALDALDVEPAHLLVTHVHLDHAGGAGYLAERYPEATVHVHERGARHLVDPSRLVQGTKAAVGDQWQFYAEPQPVSGDRIDELTDGDTVDLGDRVLDVVGAPGHAPHQVLFDDDGVLFVADAMGIYTPQGGVRPTSPPPQFDLWTCLDDVATVRDRDPRVVCYGHFGGVRYDPSLADAYADALTSWVAEVRAARAALGDDEAVVERLAAAPARAWIESYGPRKASADARLNTKGVLRYLGSA